MDPAWSSFEKFGVTGLFVFLFLTVSWYLYSELRKSKREAVEEARKSGQLVQKFVDALENQRVAFESMKARIDGLIDQQKEWMAFQKGREAGRRMP